MFSTFGNSLQGMQLFDSMEDLSTVRNRAIKYKKKSLRIDTSDLSVNGGACFIHLITSSYLRNLLILYYEIGNYKAFILIYVMLEYDKGMTRECYITMSGMRKNTFL